MKDKIGGEFEIDPKMLFGFAEYNPKKNELYSSGRSALMAILHYISNKKTNTIHLPFYICQSVVNTCLNSNFHICFYELTPDLLFPMEYLDDIKECEVLFIVNYFGFIADNNIITNIKKLRPDIIIISDHVQSFWTYDKSEADFSFTSLRKHFPVPGGALIYCKDDFFKFEEHLNETNFSILKLIGSIMKHCNIPDKLYLKYFKEGEKMLEKEFNISKANIFSQYLYEKIDFENAKKKRRENSKLVYQIGQEIGLNFLFPLNENAVPLNVPILIKKRDHIRKKLIESNIFLPVHWPISNFNMQSKLANKLSKYELSLIVDQRYSENEIYFQMEKLKKTINEV